MDRKMRDRYRKALSFEEGALGRSRAYMAVESEQKRLFDELVSACGHGIVPLLEAYTDALCQEMEMACQHFFEQGFMAQAETD